MNRYKPEYRTDLRVRAFLLKEKGMTYDEVAEKMKGEGWQKASGELVDRQTIRNAMYLGKRDKEVNKKLRENGIETRTKRKAGKKRKVAPKKAERPTVTTGLPLLVKGILLDDVLSNARKVAVLKEYYGI